MTQTYARRYFLLTTLLVVAVLVAIAAVALSKQQPAAHNAANGHATTLAAPKQPASKSKTGTTTTKPSKPSLTPQAPNGSFVSSYSINLNAQEQSICNTSSGAVCTIAFTKDGVTKSLASTLVTSSAKDPQSAFASWVWVPAQIGLTAGNWGVSATATLNGQSVTTKSNMLLDVTP